MKIIFIQLWTTGTNVKHWAKKGENIATSISWNQFHEFSRENDKFGKLKSKEISSKWTEFFPSFFNPLCANLRWRRMTSQRTCSWHWSRMSIPVNIFCKSSKMIYVEQKSRCVETQIENLYRKNKYINRSQGLTENCGN